MENVLKIIYDKTINNKILDLNDIEKILELLVIEKCLNNYILNMNVQHIRSNNLASYSNYTKIITIYIKKIEEMVENIENNILIASDFEIYLYKNLSILQIILHEIEHANQKKIAYSENSLEAFIIRLSFMVLDDKLYEYSPEEKFAEIKSFDEIITLVNFLKMKLPALSEILNTEKLRRLLSGYHYSNRTINIPIVDYFTFGNKSELLVAFDLSVNNQKQYDLFERLKYNFPISVDEYHSSMRKLVFSLTKNFKNSVNVSKKQ